MSYDKNYPETIKELFQNKEFIELLANSLKNVDLRRVDNDRKDEENTLDGQFDVPKVSVAIPKNQESSYSKIAEKRLFNRRLNEKIHEFKETVENLTAIFEIALDTFTTKEEEPLLTFLARSGVLKSDSFSSPYTIRDSQLIFGVKRTVSRLKLTDADVSTDILRISTVGKFSVAARCLCRLIKCFTLRLSSLDVYTLPHIFAFSVTANELTRQFLQLVVGYPKLFEINNLEEIVDQFQTTIVFGLREKRDSLFILLNQRMLNYLDRDDKKSKTKFTYLRPDSSPKSFLLPLSLREKRNRIQKRLYNQSSSKETSHPTSSKPANMLKQNAIAELDSATENRIPAVQTTQAITTPINRRALNIPDHSVALAKGYSTKMKLRSKAVNELFGFTENNSILSFTEKFVADLTDEIIESLENDLSATCEDIVDQMYKSEITRVRQQTS